MNFFVKGLIIGFSIAAPLGPIGILCIQRTLHEGRTSGLISGLGAATADAVYGFIAGFGLTFISTFLVNEQVQIRLFGGLFLLYLGIKTFFSVSQEKRTEKSSTLIKAYMTTFILTLTNPVTILFFAAVFAGLGAGRTYLSAGFLVAGVFSGSVLWWVILSSSASLLKSKVDLPKLKWINRGSGMIIAGFGVLSLLSLVR